MVHKNENLKDGNSSKTIFSIIIGLLTIPALTFATKFACACSQIGKFIYYNIPLENIVISSYDSVKWATLLLILTISFILMYSFKKIARSKYLYKHDKFTYIVIIAFINIINAMILSLVWKTYENQFIINYIKYFVILSLIEVIIYLFVNINYGHLKESLFELNSEVTIFIISIFILVVFAVTNFNIVNESNRVNYKVTDNQEIILHENSETAFVVKYYEEDNNNIYFFTNDIKKINKDKVTYKTVKFNSVEKRKRLETK